MATRVLVPERMSGHDAWIGVLGKSNMVGMDSISSNPFLRVAWVEWKPAREVLSLLPREPLDGVEGEGAAVGALLGRSAVWAALDPPPWDEGVASEGAEWKARELLESQKGDVASVVG